MHWPEHGHRLLYLKNAVKVPLQVCMKNTAQGVSRVVNTAQDEAYSAAFTNTVLCMGGSKQKKSAA